MRAALLGLAAMLAVGLSPARADDASDTAPDHGDCAPVRLVQETMLEDSARTNGTILSIKGSVAKTYLEAIDLVPPAEGYGVVLIYMRDDVTAVDFVTTDMEAACRGRTIPTRLHLKAMIAAVSPRT